MGKISLFVFGYRKIIIKSELSADFSAFLLKNKLDFTSPEPGDFLISERCYKRIEKILPEKYEAFISECLGARGAFDRIKCKRGLAVGLILSLIMTVFLSGLVWDIRVSGNEMLSDKEIEMILKTHGFEIGDFWLFSDRTTTESMVLSSDKRISWININRRGSVAYISVVERDAGTQTIDKPKGAYSNIVAVKNCVIEEITVKRGQAEVKKGDAVKAGDILISGVLPDEAGGRFCYAEGTVIGRCSDRIEADVSREYKKTVETQRIPAKCDVKIFNFNINIFKKYRNSYKDCDIIEDVKVFTFLGDKTLPVRLNTEYVVKCISEDARYTDDEIVLIASEKLLAKTASYLKESDLLKIKTCGEFTEKGYKMYSDIVFLTNVGQALEFYAE